MSISTKPLTLRGCRSLLQALATPGARLTPASASADFELHSVSASAKKPVAANGAAVRFLSANDVLEPHGDGFQLSSTGKAWLARHVAGAVDGFAAQHQARVIRKDAKGAALIVNDAESPLAWLRSRKDRDGAPMITDFQYQAGERLRADFEHAAMNARVTANWSNPTPGGGGRRSAPRDPAAFSDSIIAARQRYGRAIDAIGPEMASMLVNVCCHLKGLEETERGEGWPKRSGKVVLQIALTALARHYGLLNEASGNARRPAPQHWGASDYRPTING